MPWSNENASKTMDNRPIGIFDSGLGGLTAVKEIHKLLPTESLIYFGDTARIPYGTRSEDTVCKFALQDLRFLLAQNVKYIVVACGTVSSIAMHALLKDSSVPVIGIVESVSRAACRTTKNKRVAIMGTAATIRSRTIENAIKNDGIEVVGQSCPLFVPLIENGYIEANNRLLQYAVDEYLEKIKAFGADTIVLGCTHYPLIKDAISLKAPNITLINSGLEIANTLAQSLNEQDLLSDSSRLGDLSFYVSDTVAGFSKMASLFLGESVKDNILKVDIEAY